MDEQLTKLIEALEWVKANQQKAIEQTAMLRAHAMPAMEVYRNALTMLDKGDSGFGQVSGGRMTGRQEAQKAVIKVFNSVFKYVGPRKTVELTVKGTLAGQGEYRSRIITIGSFGFGTRRTQKSNSQRVDDWQGITFILLNGALICAELRKVGEAKMADLLQLLYENIPITTLMDYPTFVRSVSPARKVFGQRGAEVASSVSLQVTRSGVRWYVDVDNEHGSERISLGETTSGRGEWLVAYQQFEDVLPLVAEDARKRIQDDVDKIAGLKDRIQTTFGNYLLGVNL